MTCVRVLTPPGRAAIAVVEVVGPGAATIVGRWFAAANGKEAVDQPINAIRFGRWLTSRDGTPDDAVPGEELVIVRTAEDRVEVHCHGGAAASAAIVDSLVGDGVTRAAETEPGSITADAQAALALALTERVAGVLLDQANGALEAAIREVIDALQSNEGQVASQCVRRLLTHERLGRRLTMPWRVVLAGPPNVGKSSLINALVGYDRALVYDQPGTTRDVVTAATAIGGWPVTLSDTAGVRETSDPLEAAGVDLARRTLNTADILVLVHDAASLADDAKSLREAIPADAAVIEVANKIDKLPAGTAVPVELLPTNALAGVGIDALLAAIEEAMAVADPPIGEAVPFRTHHFVQLREIERCLNQNSEAEAIVLLQALLACEKA